METNSPLAVVQVCLFNLPVELLGKISYYCFKEFRSVNRFMRSCAFPWSILEKTQANYLILYGGGPDPRWKLGFIKNAIMFACQTGNADVFVMALAKEIEGPSIYNHAITTFGVDLCIAEDLHYNTMFTFKLPSNWNEGQKFPFEFKDAKTGKIQDQFIYCGLFKTRCGEIYIYKINGSLYLRHVCIKDNKLKLLSY